ncbi:hypothetical protein SELMODRAFT_95819 [Selaginella moellendorffii]|uniref:Protein kinase domain-containing protein n=1 Tax=Selaginella moellendorffii TaxID=88036 RepID=D8RK06_SELML|nr:serine/threonine-protein kinase prp4 [Selaginella moellendorffii]EFJ27148.1 hypothetical protein SELMODRAFT_95819 [Selaginella moellendorffii]|eukprot:XP_002971399.1 serine/threonine-protein kinase prp4 [Selaginella moellendorffii]
MFSETPLTEITNPEASVQGLRNDNPDNWHDHEFYYKARIGETINSKYQVKASIGSGMFSTVFLAKTLLPECEQEIAIKIPRKNDLMLRSAKYREHLCLVMESLDLNLRQITNKYGRNRGINLKTICVYAHQLMVALQHLAHCGIFHCDIKPDNIMVTKSRRSIKLCDFGVAMFARDQTPSAETPYLVSPSYRAPEIILGVAPYSHQIDMWSAGCCLYELYTGKFLFPVATNNGLLKQQMELKGAFPKAMLKKGAFTGMHFNENFEFRQLDPVTKLETLRSMASFNVKTSCLSDLTGEDGALMSRFKNLLERMLTLDPSKRITPDEALKHPFLKSVCK